MKKQINIFIAYSREDTAYIEKLRRYLFPLQRNKDIKIWYDGEIIAGTVWEAEIKKHLHAVDIILLLVSSNSLYSQYFYEKEVKEALERHEAEQTTVIPVILGACMWEETPLKDLQVLPKDALPINKWPNESDAYTNVVRGIRKSINIIQEKRRAALSQEVAETKRQKAVTAVLLAEKKEKERQEKAKAEKNAEAQRERERQAQAKKQAAEQHQKQIKQALQKATTAFERADYKQTIVLSKAVLKLDANNRKAEQLKSAAEKVLSKQRKAKFNKVVSNLKPTNVSANTAVEYGASCMVVGAALIGIFVVFLFVVSGIVGSLSREFTEEEKTTILNGLQTNMIEIEGSMFRMGCDEQRDGDCENDEKPVHEVTLGSYQISKYEVTQIQWELVMGNNRAEFKDCDNCPIERISWKQAQVFIDRLNNMTGKNFRLPTEAEWEYAARGGNKSNNTKYAGSNNINEVAWNVSNSSDKTHEVGSKGNANALGLYDMSGNVWEWCESLYDANSYEKFVKKVLIADSKALRRVLRGGAWNSLPTHCRVANRQGSSMTSSFNSNYGFRLASSL